MIEHGEDVRMTQAGDQFELPLPLPLQRHIIPWDVWNSDDGNVPPLGRLVRRVDRRQPVPLGLLDNAVWTDVRAGDETHRELRANPGDFVRHRASAIVAVAGHAVNALVV